MNKQEAYQALHDGYTIRNEYYSSDEWLKMVEGNETRLKDSKVDESPKTNSIPPEGKPVKEVLNNSIPFIPNLNPTGFVLTINITS